jgi:hypothetical protein
VPTTLALTFLGIVFLSRSEPVLLRQSGLPAGNATTDAFFAELLALSLDDFRFATLSALGLTGAFFSRACVRPPLAD